jgi:hypothetical protein
VCPFVSPRPSSRRSPLLYCDAATARGVSPGDDVVSGPRPLPQGSGTPVPTRNAQGSFLLGPYQVLVACDTLADGGTVQGRGPSMAAVKPTHTYNS